jgi:hypothetical protein
MRTDRQIRRQGDRDVVDFASFWTRDRTSLDKGYFVIFFLPPSYSGFGIGYTNNLASKHDFHSKTLRPWSVYPVVLNLHLGGMPHE